MVEPDRRDIVLLRHGESVGNAEARWQGQSDYPLTGNGRAQAAALAERWLAEGRGFERILSSPLLRARETAQIIAGRLGAPLECDPLWMERDVGAAAGLTAQEVEQRLPRRDHANPFAPLVGVEGEGDWDLFLRAGRALAALVQQPPGRYLVVSHGGLLNQLMHAVVGVTPGANSGGPRFRFANTGFAHLVYSPRHHRWQINTLNDRAHWQGPDSD